MFPKRLFSTQGNALSKTIHRSINTHPIKQNPFMKHQSETIPTSPDVLRANYLHKYKLEYTEKYLGEDIVSSSATEGRVRGSIIIGWLDKWLLPEEFKNHKIIKSEDGVSLLYKIHKAYGTLHHLPWKWNMDILNRYELPDEVRMCAFMADNFDYGSEQEKELLQAYANELYDHYQIALDCDQISSQANELIDKFRNTYDIVTTEDKELIRSLVEQYSRLLKSPSVKDNHAIKNKVEGDVGLDLIYLLSMVDMPELRNEYNLIFRFN